MGEIDKYRKIRTVKHNQTLNDIMGKNFYMRRLDLNIKKSTDNYFKIKAWKTKFKHKNWADNKVFFYCNAE